MFDQLAQPRLEHGAIGKAGQHIVPGKIFDLPLRLTLLRQVANGHDLAGTTSVFNGAHGEFEHLRAVGALTYGLYGRITGYIDGLPIRGPEKFIGILSDQRRFIAPQQACETRIQLDDAAIAHDRKAVQCRVDETL